MRYTAEYNKLNKEQRLAVDHIDGPLLVIAGPGTGKTQLLSVRVANILRVTDTNPENILCLTFTNKAAINMQERLLDLVGPTAQKVHVKTFHSFAGEIMNSYPDYFWHGARLSVAPDAIQLEIFRDILAKLPLDNPLALKFSGQFSMLGDIQTAIKLAKEAGLTPQKLDAILAANIAYLDRIETKLVKALEPTITKSRVENIATLVTKLPKHTVDKSLVPLLSLNTIIQNSFEAAYQLSKDTGKTTPISKWKQRWIQSIDGKKGMFDERKRNQWWQALVGVYEKYQKEMQRRNYYDYNDMIIAVNSQLEQNEELKADIQENYLYVLIDEFQDTNAAQFRLAHLVADHPGHLGNPNLMAVGDDDQTIYKFNGAELSNMLSFRRNYPSARIVVLAQNYRSRQAILDRSEQIIDRAQDRLVRRDPAVKKQLQATVKPKRNAALLHNSYPTRHHQLAITANAIKERHQARVGEIAVLARNHESLRLLAAELLAQNIPVRYEQQNNVLENEAVVELYKIASVVDAISSGNNEVVNSQLSVMLRHPMWRIDNKILWNLAVANYREPKWLDTMLSGNNRKLAAIASWLLELASQASYQPLPVMIEYLTGLRPLNGYSSPLQSYFLRRKKVSHDYVQTLSAINILLQLTREFSYNREARLRDFVRFLHLNIQNNELIADESWFVSDSNAVQLLTIHKAKGLEFDSVFVIDAIDDKWRPRGGGRKAPANLPLQPYGDDFDDYVRLMYVAITRAKQTFIATSYQFDDNGKELLATPLLQDVLPIKEDSVRKVRKAPLLETSLRWPRLAPKSEKALLRARLEEYRLSATGLLDFLNVAEVGPAYFLEKHILRLPEASTAAMSFGRAMHIALERGQILTNDGKWSIVSVLKTYHQALENEYLPVSEFQRYAQHGEKVLRRLFNRLQYKLPKNGLPEQEISGSRLGEALLTGTLDRIDQSDKTHVSIVDYKTGRPVLSLHTKSKARAIKAWKHRNQLLFYHNLLSGSDRFNAEITETQLVYVESETKGNLVLSYRPSVDELSRASNLIQSVWQHLINLNFPDVSNYPKNFSGILAFEEDLLKGKI